MSAYIVLLGSEEKHSMGDFIGPFLDHETAELWLDDNKYIEGWHQTQCDCFGGWRFCPYNF